VDDPVNRRAGGAENVVFLGHRGRSGLVVKRRSSRDEAPIGPAMILWISATRQPDSTAVESPQDRDRRSTEVAEYSPNGNMPEPAERRAR